MRNKVVYISAFLMIFVLSSGYSQKTNLSLLPSSETELKLYSMEEETIERGKTTSTFNFSRDVKKITPKISDNRRSSRSKEQRLCKMIASVCKKQWSAGLIKLFRLPTTAEIRIY